MLTRHQQILLKRAQAQAGVEDAEYRDSLEMVSGARSSTDPRVSDDHLDVMLAYLEGIYWRGFDAGTLPAPCNRSAVFVQRGYWADKNKRGNTSRDRYTVEHLNHDIDTLERALANEFHCSLRYFEAIKLKVIPHGARAYGTQSEMTWPAGLVKYKAALERTLAAKRKKAAQPF